MNTLYLDNKEIGKKVLEWLLATPKALAILICSFLSGQMWFFIIVTYLKTTNKGNTYINNKVAKTVMGLLWFSMINLPIHLLRHGAEISYDNIFSSYLYTLLYGFVLQAIIVILVVSFKKEK